jgi:hypothetical protein
MLRRIVNTSSVTQRAGAGLLVLLAGSQLIRPALTNPQTDPQRTLVAIEHPPANTAAMLDRSCRDCHTNDTRWPWYSHVAPVSWWVAHHVAEGRRRASFSTWADYDASKRVKELDEICKRVERHNMPLTSYLLVHWEARLTDSQRQEICDWTRNSGSIAPIRDGR